MANWSSSRRRRPERTALYGLFQRHLETWLARRREGVPESVPAQRCVEGELRGFLECGILACGFDQSPPWASITPAPNPGLHFDQTPN